MSEASILSALTRLESGQQALAARFVELHTEVSDIRTNMTSLRTDVTTLRTDVTTLRTDVTTLRTDVTTLRTDVTGQFTELRGDVTSLRADLTELRAAMTTQFADITAQFSGITIQFAELRAETAELRVGAAGMWAEMTTLRVELMARMDRLQNTLTAVEDDVVVNMGAADAAQRVNENTREDLRSLREQVSVMWRQLKAVEARVRELSGDA